MTINVLPDRGMRTAFYCLAAVNERDPENCILSRGWHLADVQLSSGNVRFRG